MSPSAESRTFKKKKANYKPKANFNKKGILEEEINKEQLSASQLIDSTKENGEIFTSTNAKIVERKKEIESLLEIKST